MTWLRSASLASVMLAGLSLTALAWVRAASAGAEDAAWEPIGDPVLLDRDAWLDDPSLVTDGHGAPILSFATGPWNLDGVVHVWRAEGAGWAPLGAPLAGAFSALALDPRGDPHVCSTRPFRVQRWDGASWRGVGGDIAQQTGLRSIPRFTAERCTGVGFAARGAPVVSFLGHDAPKASSNRTAYFDAAAATWRTPAEAVVSRGITADSRLIGDGRGALYLAALTGSEGVDPRRSLRVLRGDGTRWTPLGADFDDAYAPALALVGDALHLAFQRRDGSLAVHRLVGDAWHALPSPGLGTSAALGVDARGRLALAHTESHARPPPELVTLGVAVKVLDQGAWRALPSIEGGLLLGGARLALAFDGSGRAVVAAAGTASTGHARLFVRRARAAW